MQKVDIVSFHMDIHLVISTLDKAYQTWKKPAVTNISLTERNPFKVLISCIISLRTKDEVTAIASEKLFKSADTPEKMQRLTPALIANLIYPAGFYHTKASQIHEISKSIVASYGSNVPDELDELLKFKGVGRKTANLVLTLGFGKLGICVDTHVHRICNRIGYVATKKPEQTEMALRSILPKQYWIQINDLLVAFGQNCCCPISPHCTICCLMNICPRCGVTTYR